MLACLKEDNLDIARFYKVFLLGNLLHSQLNFQANKVATKNIEANDKWWIHYISILNETYHLKFQQLSQFFTKLPSSRFHMFLCCFKSSDFNKIHI